MSVEREEVVGCIGIITITLLIIALAAGAVYLMMVPATNRPCSQSDNYLLEVGSPCRKGYEIDTTHTSGVICVCQRDRAAR